MNANPIDRFRELYVRAEAADRAGIPDPNAMALATVDAGYQPSLRIVLLKDFDERGFVFYTNYHGRKGRELLKTSKAALCFYWPPLGSQVRIEGAVTKVSDSEADAYFATRQRPSQIGAWASKQSETIQNEGDLERRVAEYDKEFAGKQVTRPPFWSGFRVSPDHIEFWEDRPNRLHQRHLYVRDGSSWNTHVLYP
ncbi:MAG: pyridoxamine 5'-phosphate oxidase [Gemmatimonadaceae bacterium]|nr:pyridoxamine 5'-phosphate oxidase [Gemmatimonadaceae bacterium]